MTFANVLESQLLICAESKTGTPLCLTYVPSDIRHTNLIMGL